MLKEFQIKSFLKNKSISVIDSEIISTINLSSAFGSICEKIILKNDKQLVIKVQPLNNNKQYSSIYYEGKSLKKMHKKFSNIFPKVYHLEKKFFIMEWIEHNNVKNKSSEKDCAYKLSKLHSIGNKQYGYEFDTPIGGMQQPCSFEKGWINFFKIKRLQMIIDKINNSNPLPLKISKGIEKIINKLENYIPESHNPCLVHGDLWRGNMLFNNGKLIGLIDPAIHYADKEYELSYLIFLNTVSDNFFNYYQEYCTIEKGFRERSNIYELYHALVNVHLWDRNYIDYVSKILKKYN